ncbi:MarR family transcriptional regulator [Alkalicaulis satelles]|uniref:MarR family transcriptional regulator n=1 Tax=Alkalicaulis satelles TaxID=2609175 RepID=A0A5M6ZGJ8_9PROT|nr:MarR family transcriptional regulator [Alkalicaulis satelles]KAA5803873.1 MarR family transcriptional regulator [Alkalicaulis satelles]
MPQAHKSAPPAFILAASPGHLLHRAQQFASDQFSEATGGVELTQRQFAVLCAVHDAEGLTQTQLVQATGIDRSTLAELVSRMAAKGLLLREKAPGDARANAVRLTDEGRALYRTAIDGARAADEAILSALPKNKRASFAEALARISRAIDLGAEAARAEAKKAKADKGRGDKKKKKKKKKDK